MKTVSFFISVLLCLSLSAQNNHEPLFRIIENGKTGYITKKGDVVIKPMYSDGSNYSCGLAAVRESGLYGFIDKTGKYVLQPIYDYATDYNSGFSLVYLNGEKLIINKEGEIILQKAFIGMRPPVNNKTIVYTESGKKGVFDLSTQKLIVDTIYSKIQDFKNGVATISGKDKITGREAYSVIDLFGNYVVPTNKFEYIDDFTEDGIAIVELHDGSQGAIDIRGNLLFTYKDKYSTIKSGFHNGLAVISDNTWEEKPYNATFYRGYINTKGKIVFNDTSLDEIFSFNGNRAFIKKETNYYFIDSNFKAVTDSIYTDVSGIDSTYDTQVTQELQKYFMVRSSEYEWGIINRNGKYVVPPSFDFVNSVKDDVFFLGKYNKNDIATYSIFGIEGMIKDSIQSYDIRGYVDGLLLVSVDGLLAYIDSQGNTIWREKKYNQLKSLNVDYMLRGYNYAYSETEKYNGWGQSRNYPKKTEKRQFPKGKLSLIVDENTPKVFGEEYNGYAMYLVNKTKDTIKFAASDSRLEIFMQARDDNGNWRDIEYAPRSWCGNSYHTLKLAPDEYWEFVVPQYQGGVKTELRAVYRYYDDKEQQELYSNSISGSVNPAQFFYKLEYSPQGLMDSYND